MQFKILIVDDDKDFADYTSKRLVLRGMEVSVAYNGEDALKIVNEKTLDLVFLDDFMPGMDGIKTLRHIRKTKPGLKVVMFTGRATARTEADSKRLGALDYIQKPCDIVVLCNHIRMSFFANANIVDDGCF